MTFSPKYESKYNTIVNKPRKNKDMQMALRETTGAYFIPEKRIDNKKKTVVLSYKSRKEKENLRAYNG